MRIGETRIAVQRGEEHVGAAIENTLRTVAVMIVDVEYRRPESAVGQPLRCDGDVVEIAVAAEHVGARMVTGRASERECRPLALRDGLSSAERRVRCRERRVPG